MTKNFKEHPHYPGYYAGKDGYVYSLHRSGKGKARTFSVSNLKRLQASTGSSGYLQVNVKNFKGERKTAMVHKIVSQCYLDNGFDRTLTASHKNGNKIDNRPCNLVMETQKKNHARKYQHGTADIGYFNSRALITKDQLAEIRLLLKAGETHQTIATQFNLSRVFITKINSGYRYKNL